MRGRLRSTDFRKDLGHFWGLILDLEAETLPESKSFNAASAHMGLEGCFYQNYGFFSRVRVECSPKLWREHL